MDRIEVLGIEALGRHGVLAHEREYPQRFVVDVNLGVDLQRAGRSDQLDDTVDYGAIVTRVRDIIEGDPVDLIEALAQRVADACLTHQIVDVVEVSVHKPSAPVASIIGDIVVTIRRVRTT